MYQPLVQIVFKCELLVQQINTGGSPDVEKLKMVMNRHGLVPVLPK